MTPASPAPFPPPAQPDLLPVFNAQPGATLLLSPEWVIVGASDDYLAATLTERATIVGRFIFDAFPDNPETPEANGVANVRASLTQVLATRQPHEMAPQHYDVPDPARPGHFVERHWQPRHTPVLDAAGQVLFIIQSVQDITASRRAEQQLRESQTAERAARAEAEQGRQRFYEVLMALPAQVAIYHGPDHIYQFVNESYQRYFPAQALSGRPLREVLPEIETQGVLAVMDRVYQTGEPSYLQELELWLDFSGSGQPRQLFVNVLFRPLRDAQGRVDGLLDFSYDVTPLVLARREAEQLNQELEARVFERTQALRHAQAESVAAAQLLRHVTESLPSTSFTVDATGQVLSISPQWYAYTGMAPGADINEAWPRLIHPDDLLAIAEEFGGALVEGRPWGYEFRLRGADGRYRWFASQGQPEPLAEAEAAGRPRLWFGANLDIDDLKQAQRAQQAQEQLLATILTSLPASVATFAGEELRYTFFNETFQQQVQGRAVLGRTLGELFPEAAVQGQLDLMRGVLRTAAPYRALEALIYVQDPRTGEQQEMFLDLSYLPLRYGQQSPHGVLAFAVDVTEQVRVRQRAEALQAELLAAARHQVQERAAFHEIFEQTTALVALLRAPGHRFEYVNPAYQAVFAGRQLVGLDVAVALPEVRELGFLALMDRVYQTGETYYGTDTPFAAAPAAGPPGRVAYYNFTYQAYREAGQVAGISIFAYDVTGQVLARRERDAQRQQLHDLFMQAPAPIVILDGPALVFQLVNPAYQQIFPGRTLLGKPLLEALPELAGLPLLDDFRSVYDTGETLVAQELPLQLARHDGGPLEEMFFTFTYQARRNSQDEIDGVLVFAHEVTDQVQARRVVEEGSQQARDLAGQLAAANQQLTRTNVDLDTFIYTASHDLKAPITNIEGLLATLRYELPATDTTGEVPYILDLMQDSVERFQRTIEHLTDLSKLQKEFDQPGQSVPLAPVVEGVRLDLAPLLLQVGGRLTVDVRAVPTVMLSEKNLRSVVYNLLSNALKYRHPDRPPHVQLRARPDGDFAVLEVQDNGLGFDVGREAQLFAMFQRLHTHVEGSGVGLYMVKRLVENAGGRIAVASTVGEGSVFTVFLPC